MFKVKSAIIFGSNILIMLISGVFHGFPRGDEYLVLFLIPLVFMLAPFFLTLPETGALLSLNLIFFVVYCFTGVLAPIDVFVLMILLCAAGGGVYLVRALYASFVRHYESEIFVRQRRYNDIVNELEAVDRKGRKIESELGRISRLYEITQKLAPVLKSEALLNALFDFLEKNFRFQTAHLLTFSKGKFSRGIAKDVGYEKYEEKSSVLLEYKKVVEYVRENDFKPFFVSKDGAPELFDSLKVRADTFMVFPLLVGDKVSAILAIEGVSRSNYDRFRILIPQIVLEFRKVELYEQVQELSIIDGLTEVYLRRYLMDRLEEEVDRASRLGLKFSIGMVDVDHFKMCNDRYGHLVGDTVLKKIAERLKGAVREVDMVARYGGEEFCIVLPETTKKIALTVAERLRRSIDSTPIKAFDEEIKITVSVGLAAYPRDGDDVDTLIEKADTALYKAKRKGRNIVCSA